MATISVFGGTGYAGGHIAREAVRRGHTVSSFTRQLPDQPEDGIAYHQGSIVDPSVIAEAASADTIVVAVPPLHRHRSLMEVLPELVEICVATETRLGYLGGAGSALVSEGGPRLVDTAEFHEDWKPEALIHAAILEELRSADPRLDWFFVSPPKWFGAYAPGESTGRYRTGRDVVVTKADGSSEISGADLALAFVDEIEQRHHVRERFTVGH